MLKINKRDFLKLASGAVASGLAGTQANALAQMRGGGGGGMGGGGMGGGGMTPSVIDPPPGGPFMDPLLMPNLSTTPGVVEVNVEAREAPIAVNGVTANLLTYNVAFPAPTIRVRKSDLLRVNFTNSLPMNGLNILGHHREMTNLHTHGLHVSPMGNSDNVMITFMSGEDFVYEYDLSMQDGGTLNFYHPHSHGSVAEQYWAGMCGALIVEDEIDALAGFETHLLILKDIELNGSEPTPHSSVMDYMHGKEGNTVMVNGKVNPVLNIRPGQVQRWRILNASTARFYYLSLQNHSMYVVGTDGGLLDKPYKVSSMVVSPGERLDVLVKATQTSGSYKFLSLPYSRQGNMGSAQITLMTVAYKGSKSSDAIPATVDSSAVRIPVPGNSIVRNMTLSMGQGRGYINGISFSEAGSCEIHSQLGGYEIWDISNNSGMDHPFHQHVNPAQVLSISGGNPGYASFYPSVPAWKDVVLVPKWGTVRILVPVKDYDGMTMFHCHILEHEDIGMMGMWHIMGGMGGM